MEKESYLILRWKAAPARDHLGVGPGGEEIAEASVEERELDGQEVAEVRREPNHLAAPSMPTSLVFPASAGGPAAAEPDGDEKKVNWGVQAVGADRSPYTGKNVLVAILDSGIDDGQRAFRGLDIVSEDFTGDGLGDGCGHGTHCAGTFFGRSLGGRRIGVAHGVNKALVGKVFGDHGGGRTEWLVRGVEWALAEGAQVISMSFSIDFQEAVDAHEKKGLATREAISEALEAYRANVLWFDKYFLGVRARAGIGLNSPILVAAAGNQSKRHSHPKGITAGLPAGLPGFIAVGAVGRAPGASLELAWFSNRGASIAAPGVDILSARAGTAEDLALASGTSMATPHVAGVAALWAEKLITQEGQLRPDRLERRLLTARPLAGSSIADVGEGLVQAPAD